MKRIAVYGSLKRGKYNHSLLNDAKFIGDTLIKGTLYSLGSYPAITEGNDEYPAEVYEINDSFYERIKRMELGAGYKEVIVMCKIEYDDSIPILSCIVYYAGDELAKYCEENCEVLNNY